MDGEGKLTLIIVCICFICMTILYSFLFLALWDYRQWVGLSLLAVIIFGVFVFLRGKVTEQDLRVTRFNQHQEVPLDEREEPLFYHETWKPNPHRH